MSELEKRFEEISQQIDNGVAPSRVTVKKILDWIGVSRRGNNVNWTVRRALEHAGLETQPEFEWAYLHLALKFIKVGSDEDRDASSTIYRIDSLESANRKPVSVKPDSHLEKATTLMLTNDFSQLPVMTNERDLKGTVSWKSIGSRLALGKKCPLVKDCMDTAHEINAEASLFEAINIIAEQDYVLVRAHDRIISGIVTASDLSQQFRDLSEPFLLIGECEHLIRRLIYGKFKVDELEEARDSKDSDRRVSGVADLTFGEYVWLLSDKSRWAKLKLTIDRKEFISRIDRIREIRNDVMHFDPQGIDPEALHLIREFVRFLKELRRIGAM
jgi:CBS domain-containing protein